MTPPQRLPNPFSESVSLDEVCAIADRWGLEPELVMRLLNARSQLPFDMWIFSGIREERHQRDVSGTPFDLSTHADVDVNGCSRLSTGADVQPADPSLRVDEIFTLQMGAQFVKAGLRWGGGAPVDPETGIPVGVERWHVDLGPR